MSALTFEVLHQDPGGPARLGRLHTPHGTVDTPAFVPVGTQATVKALTPRDLEALGVQLLIANAYHLHLQPGEDLVAALGGLHRFMGYRGAIMTDSGGFQAFSLGAGLEQGVGKVASIFPEEADRGGHTHKGGRSRVRIDEEGVHFRSHLDGSPRLFTPEGVIEVQRALGSDLALVLDECTSPLHDLAYTRQAMERTHRWARRALTRARRLGIADQALYGIVQGGVYRELREESARVIGGLEFEGVAIGGSLGRSKRDMLRVLEWSLPLLPPERPRHLLGIGEVEDIFEVVARGVDTFDCVTPTRYGRYGSALVRGEPKCRLDLTAARCRRDALPPDPACECPTCRTHSRAYLHHLFRAREMLGPHLVTVHNLHAMQELMRQVRAAIAAGALGSLKAEWLASA